MAEIEEVKDPIIIKYYEGKKLIVSKEILMKAEYFRSYFERWDNSNIFLLPDDMDPTMFREVIYKLRRPTHPIKWKVLFDYYDYFGVKIEKSEKTENNGNETGLRQIITINNNQEMLLSDKILTIREIKLLVKDNPFNFQYNKVGGFKPLSLLRYRRTSEDTPNFDQEVATTMLRDYLKENKNNFQITVNKVLTINMEAMKLKEIKDEIVFIVDIPSLIKDVKIRKTVLGTDIYQMPTNSSYSLSLKGIGNCQLEISCEMKL